MIRVRAEFTQNKRLILLTKSRVSFLSQDNQINLFELHQDT